MTQVTIETIKNGPYIVTGEVELIDADGTKFPVEKRMALCRCGASTEKPFCDGTHSKIGFQAAEKAVPESKEYEILVRVIASGVNPADRLILNGKYAKEFGTHLPLILGYDMAGVVVKTGAKTTKLKVGDPVYAYLLWGGGWAEYCISNEGESAIKPKSLNVTEAASVPLAALTAWQALFDIGKIQGGQTVLIHGGSGGVGSFAIQIAKARGARVIATASTANQDLLKQIGADV